jgi:Flp pilus assembly protein TadD
VAIAEYRRLLSRNPGNIDLYLKLGETLRSKGELKNALAQFEKARQVFPKDVRPVVSVAATENLMGQKEAAQNSYRRALAMQPDNPFVMNNLAYVMVERSANLEEAKKLAQEAVKKQPQQASFLDTLGSIYQKTGQTDSALQIFNSLVKQYPDRPEFRYRQAVSLLKKGDRIQARAALTTALTQKPTGQLDTDIRQLLSQLN